VQFMNEENAFIKDLDKLIELFKKLREKTIDENIPGFDKGFFQSFDLIVNNYQLIKNQISEDYIRQIGEPLKNMIKGMIKQLQDELGEEINEKPEVAKSVGAIDALLKNPNLTSGDVDKLLDERSQLKNSPQKNPDRPQNNTDNLNV